MRTFTRTFVMTVLSIFALQALLKGTLGIGDVIAARKASK